MLMTNDRKAVFYALSAVLCWSTVATAFELALARQSLLQLLLIATLVSVVVLFTALVFRGELKVAICDWREWKLAFVCGLINPVIYYLVLFRAYELLPAHVAQPVNYTWSITLAVLSVPVLGHRMYKRDFGALFLGYSGVLVISLAGQQAGHSVGFTGIALALLSTVIWAAYWLLNTRDSRPPVVALFQNFLFALPVVATLFWALEDQAEWNLQAVISAAYVGIFEMGVAFIFWLTALKTASRVSKVSSLIFLSPFISLFLIYRVLGENISLWTLVGLAMIIAGLAIQNAEKNQ